MKKWLTAILNILHTPEKTQAPATVGWVAHNTSNHFSSGVHHRFDIQGRLVQTLRSDGSMLQYEYAPGHVTVHVFNTAGEFQYNYRYELNAEGQFSRVTKSDNPWYEELRQYNTDRSIAQTITRVKGITRVQAYGRKTGVEESYLFSTQLA